MLNQILEFSKEVAIDAGKILMKGFRSSSTEVSYKSRTNLVTNMDHQSEEFIVKTIKEKYPNHTIIAEEGSRHDGEGDYIWYIDPLDATNNYAHGLPIFCVSIGVYSRKDDCEVSGVIFNPYLDEMFTAIKGGGSFLNESKISVSTINDLGISILATGFPYEKENPEKNNLKQFNGFLPNIQGIRRMGSAAIDLCHVACGRVDGFWEPELCSWDMAAGSLIVKEAGGIVTDYKGEKFDPEFPQIVASNGEIHDEMIKILSNF